MIRLFSLYIFFLFLCMNSTRLLSLFAAAAMSLSVVSVSAMSMEGDAMIKSDAMMKSGDAMMKKSMTREERRMKSKEKAKMRASARRMRWEEKMKMMKDQGMMEKDGSMKKDMMEKKESLMKKDEKAMMKSGDAMEKSDVMTKAGMYKDHTASALPASVLSDGTIKVLFFYAGWCPNCRAANTTLTSWYGTGDGLLTTHKIDYDAEKSLRQKYGVTYQHTFVKIDGQGNLVKLLQSPSDDALNKFLKM